MSIQILAGGGISNGSSAFGPTAQVTRSHIMNLNMELALASNPWLAQDPIGLQRVAESGASPWEIMDNAAALAGMESASNMQGALRGMSPVAQRSVYNKMTEQQQRALNQMGYEPPKGDGGGFLDNTFLEGAWDLTADTLGAVTQPIKTVVSPVLGKAMDVLTWIGDVPAHFYRAIRQMEGWQQWLALGAAAAAIALTGGLGAAGIGLAGAYMGGAASLGSLGIAGALGGVGLAAGVAATAPTAITNPSEWWDFMNPFGATGVTRGERIFTKSAQERARNILGGAEHIDSLARDIAAELDVYELATEFAGVRDATNRNVMVQTLEKVATKMADPGTQEYQTVYNGLTQLMQMEEFQAAVDELQSGKISIGRDVARGIGMEQGDWGYGALSGGVDALWLLTMDPLIGLGKVGKLQQLTRRGLEVPSGEDAIRRLTQMVNEDPMIGRTVTQVADAVDKENILDMPRAWRSLFNPMLEYKRQLASWGYTGPFDPKVFMKYIEEGDGLKRIMEGKGTVRGIEHIVVSAQNREKGWGRFVESVRDFQHGLTDVTLEDDLIRTAKMHGQEANLEKAWPTRILEEKVNLDFEVRPLDGPALRETAGYQAGRNIGKGLLYVPGGRSVGNFISGISTMIPPGKAIKLTGASADDVRDAADDIPRFVEALGRHMNIPSAYREEWINTIMRQGTASQRRNALVSFMESSFAAAGLHSSDELKKLADDMLYHYKQRYALGGADVARTFDKRIIGYMPELHQAVYMVMPDLRAMSKVVRQGHLLKYIARAVDSNLAESAMSRVIKPGWLMRIGFIPRAAGEEMLAFAMRVSEGGIAQEFLARGAEKRKAIVEARQAYYDAAGDLMELTAHQREALRYGLPAHLRPFNAMFSGKGWASPWDEFVNDYLTWGANWRERGVFPQLGFLNDLPGWTETAMLGKPQSIRRAIIEGVDPDLGEAARHFLQNNSTAIMRATSASESSDFERRIVTPNAVQMLVDDASAPNGYRIEDVLLRGERGIATPTDPRYRQSVHAQAQEWAHDGITRDVMAPALTNFKPPSFTGTNDDIAYMLEQMEVVDSWTAKKLVGELLQPRQDNLRATAQQLRNKQPEIAEALFAMARDNDITASRMLTELKAAHKAARYAGMPIEHIIPIERLMDRIEQITPALDRLAAMDNTSQSWLAAVMTRQMSTEGGAWDIAQVRKWADGGSTMARPTNVWYRGVTDMSTIALDSGGNLVMIPQAQTQWGDNRYAISMSLDHQESLWFAGQVGSSGPSKRVQSGALIEIDGDFMLSEYGTNMEELRAGTSLKRYTPEKDGLQMLAEAGQGENATEIALALSSQDTIVVPKGKFRIVSNEEMSEFARTPGVGGVWGVDAGDEILTEVDGVPVADIARQIDSSLDDFIGSLTAEERTELVRQLEENTDQMSLALQSWGEENVEYEAILGGYFYNEDPQFLGNEIIDGIIDKFREKVLFPEMSENLTLAGGIAEWLKYQGANMEHQGIFTFDDAIRERLGMGEGRLIQNLFSSTTDTGGFQATRRMESRFNRSVRDGFDLRGLGEWDIEQTETWSPFVESFEDFRKLLVNEMAAQLARPENTPSIRLAERALQHSDGRQAARPPADGLSRVYSAVVNPDHRLLDEALEGSELAGMAGRDRGIVRALDDIIEEVELMGEVKIDQVVWEISDQITSSDLSPAIKQASEKLLEASNPSIYAAARHGKSGHYVQPNLDDIRLAALKLRRQMVAESESGLEAVAASILRRPAAHRYTDPVIDALTEEQRVQILADALAVYDRSKARYAQGVSQPLHGLAYSDPRIAKWVSSLLSDGELVESPLRVAQFEVPRWAPTSQGANRQGLTLREAYGDAGNVFAMDSRYAGQAVAMDAPRFHKMPYKYTGPDGKVWEGHDVVVGASSEEIYLDWAEEIVENILLKTRRGVKGNLRYKGEEAGEQVARVSGQQMEPLKPGEVIVGDEELRIIDEKGKVGKPVQFGDRRFFDTETQVTEDDLMWGLLGPMVRDVYEEKALLGRHVPKELSNDQAWFGSFREIGPEGGVLGDNMDIDTSVNMTRSRVDDVENEPANMLPDLAIKRLSTPMNNTLWDRIVRYGFSNVISPAIDALARKPMSFHYYAQAFKQNKRNLSWLLSKDLFNVQVPQEWAAEIADMQNLRALDTGTQLELMRVAAEVDGIELADDLTEIQKYLASQGNMRLWNEKLDEAKRYAMQQANAKAYDMAPPGMDPVEFAGQELENIPEYGLAQTIAQLQDRRLEPGFFRGALEGETMGSRTATEQWVKLWHDTIPDHVWEQGMDAVHAAAREARIPAFTGFKGNQWQVLKDARNNYAHAVRTADETATFRAMESVIPFLDSHEQRTMFGEYARNFIPFWYAEENFIKRWARTLSLGQFATPLGPIPSAGIDTIRKAQLTYMGIKSAGIIRTDANGDDWVVYPGSGLLNEAVAKVMPGDLQPVGVLFAANTESLLPGITDEGHISPSPLIGVPAQMVLHFFPESRGTKQALLGDIGSSRSIVSQFVPSILSNAWTALFNDEESSVRYASAMMSAMAYAEANGDGLPDEASAADIDAYLDKMRNHARIIMTAQAITGYVVPGAPVALTTGEDTGVLPWNNSISSLLGTNIEDPEQILSENYREYIQNLGIEDGTAAFLKDNALADLEDIINPLAFTASASESVSRAPLPATEKGVKWYENHKPWIDSLPEAGAWLIPQDGKDEFEYTAYRQQLANGLRKRRTPEEFIRSIKYRNAATTYFEAKDEYDRLALQLSGTASKAELDRQWDRWKAPFLAANPIFAEELQKGTARIRRDRTVQQMRYAVSDPNAPASPYLPAIKEMVEGYDRFTTQAKIYRISNTAENREKLRQLKQAFEDWGTGWALRNPAMERLWTSVYRVEAGI